MDWNAWRAEFPILSRKAYLNSCSLGALSRRAEGRILQFHRDWHEYGASAWYETWLGRIAELRLRVAAMLGCDLEELAVSHSVSAGLATVSSAIDYSRRNRVVVADLDFPTLAYQWMVRPGVEVVRVPTDDGATVSIERFRDVVDERTALVATSHVYYATGAIQDLKALAAVAHDAGALFLCDGYQGIGQLPVDVHASDVDVYIGGPLKWLLGGPGLSYLYVRRELVDRLRPQTTGWFAAENQFAFDLTHFDFKPDARRFELGTPALHMVHSALGGQEIIDEVTVPKIRERNAALTERLIARAREAGFRIRCAPRAEERSAIVMIAADNPHRSVNALADQGIIVDARPGHVRVSPHFYNTEAEVDLVVDRLIELSA